MTHFGKGCLRCLHIVWLIQSDHINDVEVIETDGQGQTTKQTTETHTNEEL